MGSVWGWREAGVQAVQPVWERREGMRAALERRAAVWGRCRGGVWAVWSQREDGVGVERGRHLRLRSKDVLIDAVGFYE